MKPPIFDKKSGIFGFVLSCLFGSFLIAADIDVDLTTNDGSSEFSVKDSNAAKVATIDSDGLATLNDVTLTTDSNLIKNQETLQSGATFYVSSGTVSGTVYHLDRVRVGGVMHRDNNTVSASNTASEVVLASVTVPANAMGTNRTISCYLFGILQQNSGGSRNITFRAKLGGTTVISEVTLTNQASDLQGYWEVHIGNDDSASSQKGYQDIHLSFAGGTTPAPYSQAGSSSVDTTSERVLELTIQFDTASASLTFDKEMFYAVLR